MFFLLLDNIYLKNNHVTKIKTRATFLSHMRVVTTAARTLMLNQALYSTKYRTHCFLPTYKYSISSTSTFTFENTGSGDVLAACGPLSFVCLIH